MVCLVVFGLVSDFYSYFCLKGNPRHSLKVTSDLSEPRVWGLQI